MAAATESIAHHLREQLEELRKSYDEDLIAPRAMGRRQLQVLFVFEVGSSAFALPANQLVEVVRAADMVAIPCAPIHIIGAIVHRQEVTSVLNLRSMLTLPEAGGQGEWVLVLRPTSRHSALLVDATIGVRAVDSGSLHAAATDALPSRIIRATAMIEDRTVAVLDSEALASMAGANGIEHAEGAGKRG